MKITSDVLVTNLFETDKGTRAIVVDVTNDLITSTADFLKLINEFRMNYIHDPKAVWVNINQAYVLATDQVASTGRDDDPKELAHNLESFCGYRIFIRGRDA